MTNSNRLDKVEDNLETVKQILMTVARRSEDAETRMEATDRRIDQLSVKVDQLTVNVSNLTATVSQVAADADAERSMMVSILERMDELQLSNTRIWQYLMSKAVTETVARLRVATTRLEGRSP